MTPLRVRARLVNGYTSRDPWSPMLDSLLAAEVMRERLGPEQFAISCSVPGLQVPAEGLPLAVERAGGHWWYAASCPIVLGRAGEERRHYHRRFDDQHERYLAGNVKRVMTSAGPYKATRLSDVRTICRGLEWHAIGDAAEVERLLRRVMQVGGRRGAGYGVVAEWRVEACGDPDIARTYRPLPVDHAEELGLEGMVLPRGLVPPVRLALVECVMPEARSA